MGKCNLHTLAYCLLSLPMAAFAADAPRTLHVLLEPSCPTVPPPTQQQAAAAAVLGEMLLTTVIGTAVDAAGAYLTSAATTKSVSLRGAATDTFYKLDALGGLGVKRTRGCLVLFVPGKEPSTQWFTMAKERAPALGLYDKLPQFYFEAAFERTADAAQTLRHSSR